MPDINIINAVEKRELARLVDTEFSKIIENLKQEVQYTESELLEEAEKKFGIKYINKEIKQLEAKIKMLEDQKEKLGFSRYGNGGFSTSYVDKRGQIIDPSTKAGRFYYMKVARNVDILALEDQRDNRLKQLWLNSDRKKITELVNTKPDIKMLANPKVKK
jgi:hypothetical protein